MSEIFNLDTSGLERITDIFEKYEETGLRTINDVLHGEGAEAIKENIIRILPVSGRHWRKKKAAAKNAAPFTAKTDQMLSVTIVSRKPYNYLYFPDDGSNTKHHAGNQHFMKHGAEKASEKIIDLCIGKLQENFK